MPEIPLHCPACGTAIPAGCKFCTSCGTQTVVAGAKALDASQPPPVAAVPPAAAVQPQFQPGEPAIPAQAMPIASLAPVPSQAAGAEATPLRFWDYLLMLLVFAVPVVGVAVAALWAFGKPGKKAKKSRKDFALARLIVWGAFFLAFLIFYLFNFNALNEFFKVMLS